MGPVCVRQAWRWQMSLRMCSFLHSRVECLGIKMQCTELSIICWQRAQDAFRAALVRTARHAQTSAGVPDGQLMEDLGAGVQLSAPDGAEMALQLPRHQP